MKTVDESATVRGVMAKVLNDPTLRQTYYEEAKRSRGEQIEREQAAARFEATKERRMAAFYKRIGYQPKPPPDARLLMSPAEAWMEEHPEEVTRETAPTRGALQRVIAMERLRFKAARERLKAIGIR